MKNSEEDEDVMESKEEGIADKDSQLEQKAFLGKDMAEAAAEPKFREKWYLSLPIIIISLVFCFPLSIILTVLRFISVKKQPKGYKVRSWIAVTMHVLFWGLLFWGAFDGEPQVAITENVTIAENETETESEIETIEKYLESKDAAENTDDADSTVDPSQQESFSTTKSDEQSQKTYKTIITCSYPKKFQSDRKKVLKFMQKVNVGKETHVILEKDGAGYKQTLGSGEYVYYGAIKDGKPNGLGMIFANTTYEREALVNASVFIPKYSGNFKAGKYDGYGMEFRAWGILQEGEYKNGKISGEVIAYHSLFESTYLAMQSDLDKYWHSFDTNEIVMEFPVLEPSVEAEGKCKNEKINDKKAKLYFSTYRVEGGSVFRRSTDALYGTLYYEGGVSNGNFDGKGKQYYESGELHYEGEFKKGKYNGKGTLYNEDGTVKYQGKFKAGDVK